MIPKPSNSILEILFSLVSLFNSLQDSYLSFFFFKENFPPLLICLLFQSCYHIWWASVFSIFSFTGWFYNVDGLRGQRSNKMYLKRIKFPKCLVFGFSPLFMTLKNAFRLGFSLPQAVKNLKTQPFLQNIEHSPGTNRFL